MGKVKLEAPKGFQVSKETDVDEFGTVQYTFSVDRVWIQRVDELMIKVSKPDIEDVVVRFGVQKLVEDLEEIIAAYKKNEGIV